MNVYSACSRWKANLSTHGCDQAAKATKTTRPASIFVIFVPFCGFFILVAAPMDK
jgi:hypothetical protein